MLAILRVAGGCEFQLRDGESGLFVSWKREWWVLSSQWIIGSLLSHCRVAAEWMISVDYQGVYLQTFCTHCCPMGQSLLVTHWVPPWQVFAMHN